MSTNIDNLVHLAYQQVGVKEREGNQVKYNDEYYGKKVRDNGKTKYHWCAVFIWWLFKHADVFAFL